jgi:KUP system potassium uptake protein
MVTSPVEVAHGQPSPAAAGPQGPTGRKLLALSLGALGVVYGDIGTSPLYALRACFHGGFAMEPSRANVLGVLSLIFWSLAILVSFKYLGLVLRADNRGEGGVLALTSLVRPKGLRTGSRQGILVLAGLFAAALLYGDGMITPAISVLSAVEGLNVATPVFTPFVIPITIVILIALFSVQRKGTRGVGIWFGPVTALWFLVIGLLGVAQLVRQPSVLAALMPWHAVSFLAQGGGAGFFVLGAVILSVTGAEALYADMGHFGVRPIRVAWFGLVLPALLLNYFGQGALLLDHPELADQPFYALAPGWMLLPLVVLATAATIIASQAMISGAFSLTRQAIQLGYAPRLKIVHTSSEEIGQVYVPEVNRFLMFATVAVVLGFRSSDALVAAYGVAVTATMVISTWLFAHLARERWRWPLYLVIPPIALFLALELSFFGASLLKIAHGAWFPLVVAAGIFALMTTWKRGRNGLRQQLNQRAIPLQEFMQLLAKQDIPRVDGTAVFLNSEADAVPPSLLHNLKHNRVLHEKVTLLTALTEEVPRVEPERRIEVLDLGQGFTRLVARYGFMENPSVPQILAAASARGLDLPVRDVSFFLSRERILPRRRASFLARWRNQLFAFMSRNALGATAYFDIPPDRVVEIGAQVEI